MDIKVENGRFLKQIVNRKGMTLLETIMAMAIVSIIAMMAFSMNSFGSKVFNKGECRYTVQSDVNLVSEYITKTVRYASSVEICESSEVANLATATVPDHYYYIYADAASGGGIAVFLRDKDYTRKLATLDSLSLLFNKSAMGDVLNYEITGQHQGEQFSLNSSVTPLNMPQDDTITDNTGTADGVAIKVCANPSYSPYASGTNAWTLNGAALAGGKVGTSYTYNLAGHITGSISSYTFELLPPSRLPDGLSMSSSGVISGTPYEAVRLTFTVRVTDADSAADSEVFFMDVQPSDLTAPVVEDSSIHISGTPNVGGTLTASYTLDANISPEPSSLTDTSTITWYRGDTSSSSTTVLGQGSTYTIQAADVNKYIFAEVAPRITYEESTTDAAGNTITHTIAENGNPSMILVPIYVPDADKPYLDNITITGTASKNSDVTISYDFIDADGNLEGATQYQWYRSTKNNESISSPTMELIGSSTGKTYTLKQHDVGYYIFIKIKPMDSTGEAGNEILSSNLGPVQN